MIYESRIKVNYFSRLTQAIVQFVLFLVLFSSASHLFAAADISDRIRFHSLKIEDGLTQSTINSIVEDRRGYIWFGTQDGLNRFDGTGIEQIRYSSSKTDSLGGTSIINIIYDNNDTLWLQTSQGLDSINIQTLEITHWSSSLVKLKKEKLPNARSSQIRAISLMDDGRLLVLTKSFVSAVDIEAGTTERLPQFSRIVDEYELESIYMLSGNIYFTDESCLISVNFNGKNKKTHCVPKDSKLSVLSGNVKDLNELFIESDKGFAVYNVKKNNLIHHYVKGSRTDDYKSVNGVVAYENGYWLATSRGLKYWSKADNRIVQEYYSNFSDQYSINNDYNNALFESSDGIFWLGTLDGVNYWESEQQFVHLLQKNEVMNFKSKNYTTSLLKNYKNELWIGTDSSGLYKYSEDLSTLRHYPALPVGDDLIPTKYIADMIEDRHRNLWIVAKAGLFLKPFGQDSFMLLKKVHDEAGNLINLEDLSTIVEGKNGEIWLGGVKRFYKLSLNKDYSTVAQSSQLIFKNLSSLIPSSIMSTEYGIYTIYEDLQGYIWLGGSTGLVRYNPINSSVDLYTSIPSDPETLSSSEVNVINEDSLGVLWIGTISGLNRVRYNSKGNVYFQRVTESDGFIDDFICSILSDNDGYLWISTSNGLIKYHPDKGVPLNFTYEDGLQYNEFFTNADFSDNDGTLFFGGINGITYFNPDEILIDKEYKDLQFTSIKRNGTIQNLSREGNTYFANVKANGVVDITFSAFDFINGKNSDYRYIIEGLTNDWVHLDSPKIRLHDIKLEQLLVRVQARQKNGRWGDEETVLLLNVNKSFWASGEGFMVYFLILSLVVIGIALYLFRYFSKRLSQQVKRLKQKHAQTQLLLSEKKTLLYQVEDLQYSLSEQKYLSERLNSSLSQLKLNDEVTGFKSKYYLKQHIDAELENIANTWIDNDGIAGVYLGVFAIDIDNLAMINKEHGHLCGNEVLKQAADCLRTISYGSDTLIRWRGATLLILSRGIEKREQMILAEKVRSIIASRKFDLGNGASIDVTCSVGFGRFPFMGQPEHSITWEQLIYVIERALLVAKNNSRNAWLGIYTNQFTNAQQVRHQITENLSGLLASGQLDYVSSIPKSNKIDWT